MKFGAKLLPLYACWKGWSGDSGYGQAMFTNRVVAIVLLGGTVGSISLGFDFYIPTGLSEKT